MLLVPPFASQYLTLIGTRRFQNPIKLTDFWRHFRCRLRIFNFEGREFRCWRSEAFLLKVVSFGRAGTKCTAWCQAPMRVLCKS